MSCDPFFMIHCSWQNMSDSEPNMRVLSRKTMTPLFVQSVLPLSERDSKRIAMLVSWMHRGWLELTFQISTVASVEKAICLSFGDMVREKGILVRFHLPVISPPGKVNISTYPSEYTRVICWLFGKIST